MTFGLLIRFLAGIDHRWLRQQGGALLLIRRTLHPKEIYGAVDWDLLVLFLGLFLILGGAEQAGITLELLGLAERWNLHNSLILVGIVTLLSKIASNVPAVMLLKGLIPQFHDSHAAWLMLAMSSTLAGNLTITGSVANIIVVEKARTETPIGFFEYMNVGLLVTILTLATGGLWLILVHR